MLSLMSEVDDQGHINLRGLLKIIENWHNLPDCLLELLGYVVKLLGYLLELLGCMLEFLGCLVELLGSLLELFGCMPELLGYLLELLACLLQLLSQIMHQIMGHKIDVWFQRIYQQPLRESFHHFLMCLFNAFSICI